MFCLNCGKEIPDNSAVCQFCGVAQPQAQQVPPQAPQEAPQQTPYGAPQQAPYGAPQQPFPSFAPPTPTKKKNKAPMIIGIVVGAIVLLAIIIGIAGSSGDDSTYDGYAPVETFGEYDIEIETIPEDAVKAADVHILKKETATEGTTTATYYCDGDEIKSWTEEFTLELDVDQYTQEELDELIEIGENEFLKYEPYSFVETNVEITDNMYIATCTFKDVSNHISDLEELGLLTESALTLYVSYDITKDNLVAQGYTEVEE